MGNRLNIHATIAVFHKEALSVLVFVGCADDGELTGLGMIVERAHPRTLLEIGRRDHIWSISLAGRGFVSSLPSGRKIVTENTLSVVVHQILRQDDFCSSGQEYSPHPEELAKQASRRMAATGLAAHPSRRRSALLRMRSEFLAHGEEGAKRHFEP